MTMEQKLYQLADDTDAYLAAIEDLRKVRRNWWAPWRKPGSQLTLNEELILDKLERAAREGKIVPAPYEKEKGEPFMMSMDDIKNYFKEEEEVDVFQEQLSAMTPERRNNVTLLRQSLK